MAECESEQRRRLLALSGAGAVLREKGKREQLERDRRRVVCLLERRAEDPLRLVDVAEPQRGKTDPAERGDLAPPVADLAERLVPGPTEPRRRRSSRRPPRVLTTVSSAAGLSGRGRSMAACLSQPAVSTYCDGRRSVLITDNISLPSRGPNVELKTGSTMRSGDSLAAKTTCK